MENHTLPRKLLDVSGRMYVGETLHGDHKLVDDAAHALKSALDELALLRKGIAWQPMRTAPKDGTALLVLLDGSDIPHAVRWLDANDPRGTDADGWHMTWDGYRCASGANEPVYWMPIPDHPAARYGPENPPRLRKPGESLHDYRISMGWPS